MKKNKMMRLASLILVLTLLTTCCISGTFAKYTTQDSAKDNARVAKWGVALQVDGSLYGEQYTDLPVVATTADLKVQVASTGTDVVAPGTKNETGFGFSLNGKPEVEVSVDATIVAQEIFLAAGTYGQMIKASVNATSFKADTYYTLNGTTYTLATAYAENTEYYTLEDEVTTAAYYPVVYKSTDVTTGTNAAASLAPIAKEIADKLNGAAVTAADTISTDGKITYTVTNKVYDPNTDLATLGQSGENITWAWDFGTNTGKGDTAATTDKADTILGLIDQELAVVKKNADGTFTSNLQKYTDYCLETSFDMNITVTQVD